MPSKRNTCLPLNGKVLKKARKRLGSTQGEVAKACGMSQSELSRLEKGQRASVGKDKVPGLVQVLKVSLKDILDPDYREGIAGEEQQPSIKKSRTASASMKKEASSVETVIHIKGRLSGAEAIHLAAAIPERFKCGKDFTLEEV